MACPHVAGAIAIELERNSQLDAPSAAQNVINNGLVGVLTDMDQEGTHNRLLHISQMIRWAQKGDNSAVPPFFFPVPMQNPVVPQSPVVPRISPPSMKTAHHP